MKVKELLAVIAKQQKCAIFCSHEVYHSQTAPEYLETVPEQVLNATVVKVANLYDSKDAAQIAIFAEDTGIYILSGDFVDGGTVTVSICGEVFTRKVKYSARKYADLYITVNGRTITLNEFVDQDNFRDVDYKIYLK